jgi:hypothetical protein
LVGAFIHVGHTQDSAETALQAAIHTEVVDGALQEAIRQYEAIARGENRAAAATALLRMGRCYERLGDAKARDAYERVVRQLVDQKEAVQEARMRLASLPRLPVPGTTVGWYNGDWQSGVPGPPNWYHFEQDFQRVYDDFVVPRGGWTVVGAFSDNHMDFNGVTEASWEIRSGMLPGVGGKPIASGMSPATQTVIPGSGNSSAEPLTNYRIQVDGLRVVLPPGRYWLSVAPVVDGKSYINATRGRQAIGDPPGNNGQAYVGRGGVPVLFLEAETSGGRGQLGVGTDFSQGVVILKTAK